MKKILMLTCSLFLAFNFAQAQVESGSFFINGNSSGIKFGSESLEIDNSNQEFDSSEFEFDVAAGYTVIDNLVAALRLYVLSGESGGSDYSTFAIGPMARYYFLPDNNFKPFGEIAILFGNIENGNTDRSLFLAQFNAGGEYFITNSFSMGAKLGVGFGNSEVENSSTDISVFQFSFGLGFSIFL